MARTQTSTYSTRRRRQTSTRSYGRNSNIAIFQPTAKIGIASRFVRIALLLASLGISFLTSTSKPSIYGNEIQKIDDKIAELEVKKSDLEVENARLTALSNIEHSEVAKNLTTPVAVNYAE